jgi:cell division protein FtsL
MNQNFRTIITFLFFIAGITIVIVTIVFVVKEKKRAHVIQDEIYALEQEKKQYEHENIDLQDKIAYLKSEHSYEKEAKKLNYKKPGEQVVIVQRTLNTIEENNEDNDTKTEEKKLAHYQIWLSYFF